MRLGALEAGGTKMVCAIGNESGEIFEKVTIPTETPDATMPELLGGYIQTRELENMETYIVPASLHGDQGVWAVWSWQEERYMEKLGHKVLQL